MPRSTEGTLIDAEYISYERFADKIVIFASSVEELQVMLTELSEKSKEVVFHMNQKKTKIMFNAYIEESDIQVKTDNKKIEAVAHYIYLGQRISMDFSKEKQINRLINFRWGHLAEQVPSLKIKIS